MDQVQTAHGCPVAGLAHVQSHVELLGEPIDLGAMVQREARGVNCTWHAHPAASAGQAGDCGIEQRAQQSAVMSNCSSAQGALGTMDHCRSGLLVSDCGTELKADFYQVGPSGREHGAKRSLGDPGKAETMAQSASGVLQCSRGSHCAGIVSSCRVVQFAAPRQHTFGQSREQQPVSG